MADETTCPMCQGPAVPDGQTYVWTGSGPVYRHPSQIQTRYRSTAADPAQVQAMHELLREIQENMDNARTCVYEQLHMEVEQGWQARIAKLLEGAP